MSGKKFLDIDTEIMVYKNKKTDLINIMDFCSKDPVKRTKREVIAWEKYS
jgi:hypothetical protein